MVVRLLICRCCCWWVWYFWIVGERKGCCWSWGCCCEVGKEELKNCNVVFFNWGGGVVIDDWDGGWELGEDKYGEVEFFWWFCCFFGFGVVFCCGCFLVWCCCFVFDMKLKFGVWFCFFCIFVVVLVDCNLFFVLVNLIFRREVDFEGDFFVKWNDCVLEDEEFWVEVFINDILLNFCFDIWSLWWVLISFLFLIVVLKWFMFFGWWCVSF